MEQEFFSPDHWNGGCNQVNRFSSHSKPCKMYTDCLYCISSTSTMLRKPMRATSFLPQPRCAAAAPKRKSCAPFYN